MSAKRKIPLAGGSLLTAFKEGDNLTLCATMLKFHYHPGHTPGVLSAEFTLYDNGTIVPSHSPSIASVPAEG